MTTFVSGFAWGFWSLFVFRLCVGIGEATCAPTASSLIGDLVPARRRSLAMSFFMLGLPVGLALSFFVSGCGRREHYGWRTAFFVAGVPGLLLAVAVLFILDPRSRAARNRRADRAPSRFRSRSRPRAHPGHADHVADHHLRGAAQLQHVRAGDVRRVVSQAVSPGHDRARPGWSAAWFMAVGALGLFAAGWLGDRAFRRGPAGRLHVAWIGLALAIPCLLFALAAPPGRLWLCVAGLLPGCLLLYAYYGTVYATIQDIVEPASRGMAMAIYFCAMYLLGAVLGPVATGWTSDYFAGRAALADGVVEADTEWHKAVGLHHAMYLIPILDAALVVVLFAAARTVKRDYQNATERAAT